MDSAATAQTPQAQAPQQVKESSSARVSVLDPDFILAFGLALILDLLSYIFLALDGGVVAAAVNIVLGGILIVWMTWRGKRLDEAKQQYQEAVQTAQQGREGLRRKRQQATAKRSAKRASRTVTKKTSRRLLRRAIFLYIGTSIPIINLIPFWVPGVILMLREK